MCPTFQAQLIAHFLCHDEAMIYLTNFHPANKPTFVLPGGHFPHITAQPGVAAPVGRGMVARMMNRGLISARKMGNHGGVPMRQHPIFTGTSWHTQPWNHPISSCILSPTCTDLESGARCSVCPNSQPEFTGSVLRKAWTAQKDPELQLNSRLERAPHCSVFPPRLEQLCVCRAVCALSVHIWGFYGL